MLRKNTLWPIALSVVSAFAMAAAPAAAQVRSVDPDRAIDGDLGGAQHAAPVYTAPVYAAPAAPMGAAPAAAPLPASDPVTADPGAPVAPAPVTPAEFSASAVASQHRANATFHKDDLIGAAEGVFGKGARGLASIIEDILKKQGEPNGYIIGREGGGAFVVGLRYGSGTLYHKIEGQQPVYWTGPSVAFDAGANAGKAFVLVYNLYDTEDLYKRFGAGEGQAYLVGGFNVSYLRRGDVVLVPVRMGAGLRLGINAGYMKFSHRQKWLPF
jgi:hypothetical protein